MAKIPLKDMKSARKALDVTFRLGNYKKFYKNDIARASRALRETPRAIFQAVKEATPEEFLKVLKRECSHAIRMAGSKHDLSTAATKIRQYLSENSGYPFTTLTGTFQHTGKMLGDALIVGQRGEGSKYEFWIGISAVHRSHVGTKYAGSRYADIARILDMGITREVTEDMRTFLHSAGVHLRSSTKTITIEPIRFSRDFAKKAEDIVESHLYNELPMPNTLGKAAKKVIG